MCRQFLQNVHYVKLSTTISFKQFALALLTLLDRLLHHFRGHKNVRLLYFLKQSIY